MKLGMIGLGRMGANMARGLMEGGHQCVGYDRNQANVADLASHGAAASTSLEGLVAKLEAPRAVWVMVPAGGPTEETVAALFTRFRSRIEHSFAEKVLSAMRKGFGGHVERPRVEKVNPGL